MGEFEQLVLLAILRLDNDAYGMEARAEIEESMGEPTAERGGRARKYFRVEAAGREALRATRDALTTMWDGVAL